MNSSLSRGVTLSNIFYIFYASIICIVYLMPRWREALGYFPMTILTLPFAIMYFQQTLNVTIKAVGYMLVYASIMFLIAIPLDFKYGFLLYLLYLWIYIFPLLMCVNVIERGQYWEQLAILIVLILGFTVIVRNTASFMGQYPQIMREITSGNTDEVFKAMMISQNVGGFGIAYGCGAAFVAIFGFLFVSKVDSRIYRYLLYFWDFYL